jgi:hypothetical protein
MIARAVSNIEEAILMEPYAKIDHGTARCPLLPRDVH